MEIHYVVAHPLEPAGLRSDFRGQVIENRLSDDSILGNELWKGSAASAQLPRVDSNIDQRFLDDP